MDLPTVGAPQAATEGKFRLSARQVLYLSLMNGIGPTILNGAVNFGLATAMYRGNPIPTTVWKLPGSLAGDAFVTIMIQVTLTWVISGILTRKDVEGKKVKPVAWVPPTSPWWLHYFLFGGDFDFVAPGPPKRIVRLLLSVLRGVVFAGLCSTILWPLSLIYLLISYGNGAIIPNWPTPQIYKGVQGAVVGLITTPIIATLALVEGYRVICAAAKPKPVIPTSTSQLLKLASYTSTASEPQLEKELVDSASMSCFAICVAPQRVAAPLTSKAPQPQAPCLS